MFRNIKIVGEYEAAKLLASDPGIGHVISITDPDDEPPPALATHQARRLVLHFHDLVDRDLVDRDLVPGVPPVLEDVKRIADFARDIAAEDRVLVHCGLGHSRSPAAAATLMAARTTPGDAEAVAVFRQLRAIAYQISPNSRMIRFADEHLGWEGALVHAYRAFFPRAR